MRKFLSALVAMLAVAKVTPAMAAFPDRPIHIVVPYVPGVGADIASRLLSEKLTSIWGVSVIVDNKPGASIGDIERCYAGMKDDAAFTRIVGRVNARREVR
jgi:tripartite-type tricarboxylate transporter receptor subunit TctC